jgi:hypothetical protein
MTRLRLLARSWHPADNDDGDRPPPIARARALPERPLDEDRGVWARGRGLHPVPLHASTREVAMTLRHAA